MIFENFLKQTAKYLEDNIRCQKHKIEHTGKNIYAVVFYSHLGQLEKGKKLILNTVKKITKDGESWIFYPGRLDHYNKSNNVIDCGAIVDSISSFLKKHKNIFTKKELYEVENALEKVVYTYLTSAAINKPITNQRLWGLTGLASYYDYSKDEKLVSLIKKSIEISLDEMTRDGFFIYYPKAKANNCFEGYSGLTTYYQSRHTSFLYYSIEKADLDLNVYQPRLEKSIEALLGMYKKEGYKDLNLECKRWYWLGDYEVASNSFDIYALSKSNNPLARQVLNNSLVQIKNHFYNGHLHSHKGVNNDFQCYVFWNAHLAWLVRAINEKEWDEASFLKELEFDIKLDNLVNVSGGNYQIILNNFWQPRNFTSGILNNGLPNLHNKFFFRFKFICPRKNILISIRENIYHTRVAFHGMRFIEGFYRFFWMIKEIFISFMPIYQLKYGKINRFNWDNNKLRFEVVPATKFGALLKGVTYDVEFIFNRNDYHITIKNRTYL